MEETAHLKQKKDTNNNWCPLEFNKIAKLQTVYHLSLAVVTYSAVSCDSLAAL